MEHDRTRTTLPPIPAPEPFAERRRAFRRDEDRAVHEERALLARALDVLAGPGDAATHVAEILALVARAVGADRAAVVTDRPARRVLVTATPGEDPAAARALAAWLDADVTRPAAIRAAGAPAEVTVVRTRHAPGQATRAAARVAGHVDRSGERYVRLIVPKAAVQLGLELADPADAASVAGRLPASTLRHLVAALAAGSARATDEAELAALRARERERERFVSVVAHELRTPLAGLGGYLDLLAAGAVDDPETGREFLERGRGIVERMALLVGDLLELSRLEAGSVSLEIAAVSLAEACDQAVGAVAPVAAARRLALHTDLPARLRTVRADRRRLEQVVTNLLGNACKFTGEEGHVELAARIERSVALIVVRDDGAGIEAGDRERVFRPFARLDGHEGVTGTGLGLPISRDLARAMGGDIDLASVPGSGTAFVVGLPADADTPRSAVAAAIGRALEAEELALEERAVLRALRERDPARPATEGRSPRMERATAMIEAASRQSGAA